MRSYKELFERRLPPLRGGVAIQVDNTDALGVVYDPGAYVEGEFTWAAWLRPTDFHQGVIWGSHQYDDLDWHIEIMQWTWGGAGEALGLDINSVSQYKYKYWSHVLDSLQWRHVVVRANISNQNGSDGQLWMDGVEQTDIADTQSGSGDLIISGGSTVIGGSVTIGLAHIGVWNRYLTEEELLQLPHRSPLFFPANLVLYDPFSAPRPYNYAPYGGAMGPGTIVGPGTQAVPDIFPQVEQPITIGPGWVVSALVGLDVSPAAAVAAAAVIDPSIELGDASLTPDAATAKAEIVNPSVTVGGVNAFPSPAVVVTSRANPQVVLDSLAISPEAAAANAAKTDPIVAHGSIQLYPDTSAAAADSVDPTVLHSGINIGTSPAAVSCSGVDPNVEEPGFVFPDPISAGADSVAPEVYISSLNFTPSPATAATVAWTPLSIQSEAVSAAASAIDPTVNIASITAVYPLPATATASTIDPSLYFTDSDLYPPPAAAGADSVDPTYYVYGGGYPVVRTSPAETVPVTVDPTTNQESLLLTPDIAEAVTESIDPTLFFSSTSASPSPASAGAASVDPIAGAFFRYFMEADVSLGGWTNELDSSIDIYTSIDEDPHDDDDYIQSDWGPEQEAYKGKMERMSEPDDDTSHYVEYRYKKANNFNRMDIVIRLRQGSAVITGWSHDDIGLDFVTQRQLLTEEDALLITDYQDLYLEFEAWERY